MKRVRLVAINEAGYRIGESHHNARISDAMVNRMRDMHEHEGAGPKQIASDLRIAYEAVCAIIYYRRRTQVPRGWRRIEVEVAGPPEGFLGTSQQKAEPVADRLGNLSRNTIPLRQP